MRRFSPTIALILGFGMTLKAYAVASTADCAHTPPVFKHSCQRLHQIWYDGKIQINIHTYAWHNRFLYAADKIPAYNEHPWGGGLGRSLYDEDGDFQELYAFAFLDSHKNIEPIAGYGFEKLWHLNDKLSLGPGYTVFLTSRPDIFHAIPFPGILPLVGINYDRASVVLIYIPGKFNIGNVLFILAKWAWN